jgi:hypothetical protein
LDTTETMKHLFSPCTRYREILESQDRLEQFIRDLELLRELNLDVSTEEFLSAERCFTYADLNAMIGNGETVAWLTPHAAVAHTDDRAYLCASFLPYEEEHIFSFNVDGTEIFAVARSSAALSEIVDVVRRLLAANARDVYKSMLQNVGHCVERIFNAPSLAYLTEQCQNLKALTLEDLVSLYEDHFRVLGALSRPDLEIKLNRCDLRVLEQVLWQRYLDAIRDRPCLMNVILTIPFSRMGCAETIVCKA